jgi:hypothetical protein
MRYCHYHPHDTRLKNPTQDSESHRKNLLTAPEWKKEISLSTDIRIEKMGMGRMAISDNCRRKEDEHE